MMTESSASPEWLKRWIAVMVLASVLFGALAIERDHPVRVTRASNVAAANSTSFYCVGAGADGAVDADTTIAMVNTSATDIHANVTIYTNARAQTVQTNTAVTVAVRTSQVLRLSRFVRGDFASAEIHADHAGLSVSMQATGSLGLSTTPCATSVGSTFYFADGATDLDSNNVRAAPNLTYLSILNPSADQVSVTVNAQVDDDASEPNNAEGAPTDEELRSPDVWNNLDVAPHSLLVLNVGRVIQRRISMALTVSASPGRIVVGQLILRQGVHRRGLTLSMGRDATTTWQIPFSTTNTHAIERLHIYNPSSADAQVLAQPIFSGAASASLPPLQRTVPGGVLDFLDLNTAHRIPLNQPHSWTIQSNVPIVVADSIDSASGIAMEFGETRASTQLIAPFGRPQTMNEVLYVFNPTSGASSVNVYAVADGHETIVAKTNVASNQRAAIKVPSTLAGANVAIFVQMSSPLYAALTYNSSDGSSIYGLGPIGGES